MKLIHVRDEGEPIRPGLNFYPQSSNHVGFVINMMNTLYRFRFSKLTKRIHITKTRINNE